MYVNFYEEYIGIENNVREAANNAASHSVSNNICSELQTIIEDLSSLNSALDGEGNDTTVANFSSSIATDLTTLESVYNFLVSDYMNVEKVYQLLEQELEILKELDGELQNACKNEPEQQDYKKEKIETSYNAAGEKVEKRVTVNDTERFKEAHTKWENNIETIKSDCINAKNRIDEYLEYLQAINNCIPSEGATRIQVSTTTTSITPIETSSINIPGVEGTSAELQTLTYTYETGAGPTTVFYSIIPPGKQPQLAIATDSKGNLSYKYPWKLADEVGAKIAINFSIFGSGRNDKYHRDGGRGVDYDGKNLFIGSHYNCDTTLYMTNDGKMGYIDNTIFKSKSDVAPYLAQNNVKWAAKGFYPIIDNYNYVNNNTDSNIGSDKVRHPRTFVGQLENGSYIIGVCSGRNSNSNGQYEHGMTVKEIGDFVQNYATDANGRKIRVRFLMNGDGGGSSAYVVDGEKQNVSGEDRATTDILYLT